MNTISIPQQLRGTIGGKSILEINLTSIKDLIEYLSVNYPLAKDRLIGSNGEFNKFILVYLNGEDIRFLDGINTTVKDGDEISIIPAMAGG